MDARFTSAEVVSLTGISARQLQWWDERGIVVPEHEGHKRLYSLDDLTEIAVICDLRRRGFSLQRVRKVIRLLQREFEKRLVDAVSGRADFHLLTDGNRIYLKDSAQQVIDVLKNSRQPMLTVCLSDTVRQIRAGIRQRKMAMSTTQAMRSRNGGLSVRNGLRKSGTVRGRVSTRSAIAVKRAAS